MYGKRGGGEGGWKNPVYCMGRPRSFVELHIIIILFSLSLLCIYFSLEQAKFPTHLLPEVIKPEAVAGKLQRPFYNIPAGTPVGVGLGDFQCSVLASMSQQSDAGDIL